MRGRYFQGPTVIGDLVAWIGETMLNEDRISIVLSKLSDTYR